MSETQNMLLMGQPGAGKTTIGKAICENYKKVVLLDGDMIRMATANIDYSPVGRNKNIQDAITTAKILNAAGYSTVFAMVCPFKAMRDKMKEALPGLKIAELIYNKNKRHRPRAEYWVADFENEDDADVGCFTDRQTIEETFHMINSLWLRQ